MDIHPAQFRGFPILPSEYYLERTLRCMGVFSPRNRDKTYHAYIGGESAYIFSTPLNV